MNIADCVDVRNIRLQFRVDFDVAFSVGLYSSSGEVESICVRHSSGGNEEVRSTYGSLDSKSSKSAAFLQVEYAMSLLLNG